MIINCNFPTKLAEQWSLRVAHEKCKYSVNNYQRGIITIHILSLIIGLSIIITEEHGKTIDIIFIDAKQYDGRKDISRPKYN